MIRKSVDGGIIAIASGGDGIPVILDEQGPYKGVEVMIDNDPPGESLARAVDANVFLF